MLEKVFESHKKWINTTIKFGCSKEEAEDIVGQMYLIIGKMLKKGLNIAYGDDVNYYYIYLTLRTTFLQMKNKQKKENKALLIQDNDNSIDYFDTLEVDTEIDFNRAEDIILGELDKLHWYDKRVFNLIENGMTLTELSNKTGIYYHSLYNTYRKTKAKLKEQLLEKY